MNDDIVIKVQERYGEAARHADRSCDCDCGENQDRLLVVVVCHECG